jgi:VanZ family protein
MIPKSHRKRIIEAVQSPDIFITYLWLNRTGIWRWGPVFLYCSLIFWLSSQPNLLWLNLGGGASLESIYGPSLSTLLKHFVEYLILGLLTQRACTRVQLSFLFSGLYGMSDEVHQFFVPMRHFSAIDVLADFTGAFMGVVIWYCLELISDRNHPDNNRTSSRSQSSGSKDIPFHS